MPRVMSRRGLAAIALGAMAAPTLLRAQSAGIDQIRTTARGLDQLHVIMIRRGDDLLLAEAFRGPGLTRGANIKSCSKSILSLLLGTAIARGEIDDVGETLAEVAPRLIPSDATPGVAALTMENLVTLRAGLEGTSGPNYGAWVGSGNWVGYALRRPMISQPGTRMIYSTGTTHVLGAALATATGSSLLDLTRTRLAEPLGFSVSPWTRDPQGFYFGGNDMLLTPEAMLRIGMLMRDGGRYGDRQVIDADWIRASTRSQTRSPYSGLDYGYGWFLSRSGWIIARGYGGQIIAAHPRRALAVAITSDPNQPARSEGHFGDLMRLLDGPVLALG